MARDWRQWNKAMDRMIAYLMQSALRQQGQDANIEFLEKQLENTKTGIDLRKEAELEILGESNEFRRKLAEHTALLSLSGLPEYQNIKSTIAHHRTVGNTALADQITKDRLKPFEEKTFRGVIEALSGKELTPEGVGALGSISTPGGMTTLLGEAVGERKALRTEPTTRMQAGTARMRAETEAGKAGLDKEKWEAGQTGVFNQEEYAEDIAELIDDATDWLDAQEPDVPVALSTKEKRQGMVAEVPEGGLTEERRKRIRVKLQKLKLKSKTKRLTEGEEDFITSVSDISKASEMTMAKPVDGETGQELPMDRVGKLTQYLMDEAEKEGKEMTGPIARALAEKLLKKR